MPFITKDGLNKRLTDLERRVCCNRTLFYENLAAFPLEGKVDTIYVDESNGAIYIWNGTEYITADFQPVHTNVTEAVPYTGTELPTIDGVVEGDTVSAEFNNNIIADYTWDGAVWVLNFTTKAVASKIYKALLTQVSTSAPTALILENTLGTITYSYDEPGIYLITSAGLFTAKTAVTFGSIKQDGPGTNTLISGYKIDASNFLMATTDSRAGGGYNDTYDGILLDTLIQIEVYP